MEKKKEKNEKIPRKKINKNIFILIAKLKFVIAKLKFVIAKLKHVIANEVKQSKFYNNVAVAS